MFQLSMWTTVLYAGGAHKPGGCAGSFCSPFECLRQKSGTIICAAFSDLDVVAQGGNREATYRFRSHSDVVSHV